eukprot:587025-Amorphochlora_amoeboformis.AAC.1
MGRGDRRDDRHGYVFVDAEECATCFASFQPTAMPSTSSRQNTSVTHATDDKHTTELRHV